MAMIRGRRKGILAFMLFLSGFMLKGQDVHFSQFRASPAWLNPAFTGTFTGDIRLTSQNRSQWNSFTNGFRTMSFACESNALQQTPISVPLSAAILVSSDRAGDGRFGISSVAFPVSVHFRLTREGDWLTFALMPGWTQHSLDYGTFRFGEQFDGVVYDPSLPTLETGMAGSFSYFDFTAGLSSGFRLGPSRRMTAGVGLFHFNRPVVSFMDDQNIRLEPRISVHAEYFMPISRDMELQPAFLYSRQNRQREWLLGSSVRMATGQPVIEALIAGVWTRVNDALILEAGMEIYALRAVFSYDINYSGLRKASRFRGGPELSLLYLFEWKRPLPVPPFRDCPVY